jgi:SAM-dependent methyltransferase
MTQMRAFQPLGRRVQARAVASGLQNRRPIKEYPSVPMTAQAVATETRSPERLHEHYIVERQLADRLRQATPAERAALYSTVYDELFRRVPDHPQLTRKASADAQAQAVASRWPLLARFLKPSSVFMEIGPGDCSLALAVAARTRHVYAVDVSAEITRQKSLPDNFELIICEGASIPVPADSVDVAFSYQLIEHLHPADAREHVQNVHRALAPGGHYVCVTPNRLNGPHDISRFFDQEARGSHMKEYTNADLASLFIEGGFSRVQLLCGARGRLFLLPAAPVIMLERVLSRLPFALRHRVASAPLIRQMLGVTIVASRRAW